MARTREQRKIYSREWRAKHKDDPKFKTWQREHLRKQYLDPEYKIKQHARAAVHKAIKSGKLIRPDRCERCGAKARITADHADYSKKLEVSWLCYQCHADTTEMRKKMASAKQGKQRPPTD